MSKTYQIQAVDAKGQRLLETLRATPGQGPVTLQALPGVRYTLIDVQQHSAPDNIRVQRAGKHLRIWFDGAGPADVVLENYYERTPDAPPPTLAGASDSGSVHAYVGETGQAADTLSALSDGQAPQGMALGAVELPSSASAAAGLLAAPVAASGLGLGAVGAGVLGAAALGGGGNSAAPVKPSISQLKLAANSDSGPRADNITNPAHLPDGEKAQIMGKATAGATIKITTANGSLNLQTTADDKGDFSLELPSGLNPGLYTLQAVATLGGVASDLFIGTPFTIDTSSAENFDANGNTVADANTAATFTGLSLSDDSGKTGDLKTSGAHQTFTGTLDNYSNNGDKVRVRLSKQGDASFALSDDLTPNAQNQWVWDQSQRTLAPGMYTLQAKLVDGAGNDVRNKAGTISRTDTLTISAGNGQIVNPDGTVSADANSSDRAATLIKHLRHDTGINPADFLTNDNTPIFSGLLERFTRNGDMVKVQLKQGTAVLYTDHLSPTGNDWTWDLSSRHLNDGAYELSAAIVDAGGSAVSGTTSSSQKLVIDTSTSKNQSVDAQTDDANGALALVLSSMTDTADGVHAGTGNDKITKSTTPVFSGHFGAGKTWTSNGDVFQFSVQNLAGDVIDLSPTLGSGSSNWTSANWSTPLANDALYIAKARILDAAGNVLSTRQQAFALDKTAPSLQFTETVKDISIEGSGFSNGMIVSKFSLSSNEAVHYTLKSGNQVLAQGDYTGAAGSTNQTITGSFEAGTFVVSYTDLAGNTSEYTHTSKLVFNNVALTTALPTHGYTAPPAPQQALGTIGTIRMAATQASLDLSAIVADSKIHNHIDMADPAAQQLTLNLNDVLSLGASNSFRVNDLLQIRVDGGNNDRVQFKDRSAWAVASPTVDIGSDHYTLYTSHDAQLHVVEVLIQQGIQVS